MDAPLIRTFTTNNVASSSNPNGIRNNNINDSQPMPSKYRYATSNSNISLWGIEMTDTDKACSYKRPLHEFNGSGDNNNYYGTVVAFGAIHNSCNDDSTTTTSTILWKDDAQQFNKRIKRLRYTPEEFNDMEKESSDSHHNGADIPQPHPSSASIMAFPTETTNALTTTGTTLPVHTTNTGTSIEDSKRQSVPWWVQQQRTKSLSPTLQTLTRTCRICHKQYTATTSNSHSTYDTKSNTTTNYHNDAPNVTDVNSKCTTKTLLSYFPLKSTLVDNNKTKPRCNSTTATSDPNNKELPILVTRYSNHANHNIVSTTTAASRCHYCEHDNFCSSCTLQSCTTCSYLFCYFCRTIHQNGDVQCIDCYSDCANSTIRYSISGDNKKNNNVIERQKIPPNDSPNHDAMDVD